MKRNKKANGVSWVVLPLGSLGYHSLSYRYGSISFILKNSREIAEGSIQDASLFPGM